MPETHCTRKPVSGGVWHRASQVLAWVACASLVLQSIPITATAQGFGLGGVGTGNQQQGLGAGLIPLPFTQDTPSPEPSRPAAPERTEVLSQGDPQEPPGDPALETGGVHNVAGQSPAALARGLLQDAAVTGPDAALFLANWVEDNVRLAPYRGVLKGGAGVLLDGEGNSLDRALLLAQMLEAVGTEARLARVLLTPDAARRLLVQSSLSLPPVSPDVAEPLQFQEGEVEALLQGVAESDVLGPRYERVLALGDIDQHALAQAILQRLPPPDQSAAQFEADRLRVLQEYWIVLPSGGDDTALVIDEVVADEALAAERVVTTAPEILQDPDLAHRVTIRFVAIIHENGSVRNETILSQDLTMAQRLDGKLTFHLEPIGLHDDAFTNLERRNARAFAAALPQTWAFVPMLGIDGERFAERGFSLDGRLRSAEDVLAYRGSEGVPASRGLFGMMDNLQDIAEPRPQDAAVVAGHLELVMPASPFAPADRRTHVREVFDLREPLLGEVGPRLDPSSVAEALADGVRPVVLPRLLPVLDRSVLRIDHARMTFAHEALERKRLRVLALKAQSALEGGDIGQELSFRIEAQSLELLEFAIEREFAWTGDEMIGVPNLAILERGLRTASDGTFLPHQLIDIVENRRDPIAVDVPFAARVSRGVRDTIAEAITFSAFFDAPVHHAIIEDIANAKLILDVGNLANLDLTARVESLVQAELRAGNAVFLGSTDDGRHRWWRVDRQTGQSLGILDTGQGGVVSTEYWILFKKNAMISGSICAIFSAYRLIAEGLRCGRPPSGQTVGWEAGGCIVVAFVGGVLGAGTSALGPLLARYALATSRFFGAERALIAARAANAAAQARAANILRGGAYLPRFRPRWLVDAGTNLLRAEAAWFQAGRSLNLARDAVISAATSGATVGVRAQIASGSLLNIFNYTVGIHTSQVCE